MRQNILILENESCKIQNIFLEKDQKEEYLNNELQLKDAEI